MQYKLSKLNWILRQPCIGQNADQTQTKRFFSLACLCHCHSLQPRKSLTKFSGICVLILRILLVALTHHFVLTKNRVNSRNQFHSLLLSKLKNEINFKYSHKLEKFLNKTSSYYDKILSSGLGCLQLDWPWIAEWAYAGIFAVAV